MEQSNRYNFLPFFLQEEIYLIEGAHEGEIPVSEAPVGERENLPNPVVYGENKKGVIVLVDIQTHDLFRTPEYDLLLKMMTAVKMSMHEIALVNVQEQPDKKVPSLANLNGKKFIAFGIRPESLGFSGQAYALVEHGTGTLLPADSLSDIAQDVQKKQAVWKALRLLFDLD